MTTKRLPQSVLLCAIRYRVAESDGLIVFTEDCFGMHRFSFARRDLCWYLEMNEGKSVMMGHVEAAYRLVVEHYGKDHFPK